jgi:hypothetical protein
MTRGPLSQRNFFRSAAWLEEATQAHARRVARIADARVAAELKVEPPQILCAAANDNRDVSDARIS